MKNTVFKSICDLCFSFWSNWELDTFRHSKWPSAPQFCERYICSWQKKWPKMVVKWPSSKFVIFFTGQSLLTYIPFTKKVHELRLEYQLLCSTMFYMCIITQKIYGLLHELNHYPPWFFCRTGPQTNINLVHAFLGNQYLPSDEHNET